MSSSYAVTPPEVDFMPRTTPHAAFACHCDVQQLSSVLEAGLQEGSSLGKHGELIANSIVDSALLNNPDKASRMRPVFLSAVLDAYIFYLSIQCATSMLPAKDTKTPPSLCACCSCAGRKIVYRVQHRPAASCVCTRNAVWG